MITYKTPATAAAQPAVTHDSFAMALFDAASTTSGTSSLVGAAHGSPSATVAADPLAAKPVHATG